jgi:hypothetical protein
MTPRALRGVEDVGDVKTKASSAWNGHLHAMERNLRRESCTAIPTKTGELKQRCKWRVPSNFTISVLLACIPACQAASILEPEPSNEILEKVAASNIKHYSVAFSVLREYKLHNLRFDKEATVSVQVTYLPGKGMTYTILESSGSPKLAEIVGKLLTSEVDTSSPEKLAHHLISPANYEVHLRDIETMAGSSCYVMDLVPKHKSKYLMKGTAWVDRNSYDLVRLEGVTSASVSMWVGTPHIEIEFSQIDGLWLPVRTGAVSSGLLLGTSELEIRYCDYVIMNPEHLEPSRPADAPQQSRQ